MKFKIVERYIRNERGDKAESTNVLTEERLNSVLTDLVLNHGVRIGDESIEGLSGLILSDWKGSLVKTHKISTANNVICIMRPFLRWLYNVGVLERDFSPAIKTLRLPSPESLPESERPKDKYLTHEQAQELLNSKAGYNGVRDRAIIAMMLYTGLRTSELCSLNVGDLKTHGVIEVKRKGGKYCKVPIPDALYPYLEEYLKTRNAQDGDPLFSTTRGTRLTRNQLYRSLAVKQKAVGVAQGGHALRHTFVSETMKLGGAAAARDLANHRTLAITNRYSHTTEAQRREVVNALAW